ncbi:type II toxin-antitoxin system YafO family toxin [Xanthomonas citri]|uniref:type II toxin-antitoxin system YafO family toxin n=1 Tax=Xanthomonas citri TaxID=346 RepID=UPI000C397CDE|nr:type II toxin-antitoxin system YafO family toxin [Xanthomonas citri]SOO08843.1 conserved hypothetical protein [Xanthomonas citri pv. fuscans]
MAISLTKQLSNALEDEGIDADLLVGLFQAWKDGKEDPSSPSIFGKNVQGLEPVIAGQRPLWHVHLIPAAGSVAFRDWMSAVRDNRPPTSDRVLFYAVNGTSDFLLIYLIDDPPGAHKIYANKRAIAHFGRIADTFHVFGTCAA